MKKQMSYKPPFFFNDLQLIEYAQARSRFYIFFITLFHTLCSLIIMNSQQNSFQRKKIIVLLLMQEVFKKNNRVFNANTHLLTFTFYTNKHYC